MSFFDKAKQALTGAVDKHGDKISEGIDKTAEMIDDRTGGKHADKLGRRRREGQGRPRPPRRPQ